MTQRDAWREEQQRILEHMRTLPDDKIRTLRYGLHWREEAIRPVHAQLLAERGML